MDGFMNYIFIINPVSGKGKGREVARIVNQYCIDKNVDYKILYTTEKGDAEYLASLYKNSKDNIIYSVGGDGTLNEVVNGMVNSYASLGVIPAGSGNDFYKSLKINDNSIIDLGKVNSRYFINIASIGLDAEIAKSANNLKNYNMPNDLVYIMSLFKNYFTYDYEKIKVDDIYKYITILTICNGKYYGGGFEIAPNAKLNDGMFDVIETNRLSRLKIIKLLCKLYNALHINDMDVKYYKTNNITVESQLELNCNIDGEIITGRTFNFSTVPNALKLYKDDELKINQLLKEKKIIK